MQNTQFELFRTGGAGAGIAGDPSIGTPTSRSPIKSIEQRREVSRANDHAL